MKTWTTKDRKNFFRKILDINLNRWMMAEVSLEKDTHGKSHFLISQPISKLYADVKDGVPYYQGNPLELWDERKENVP